MPEKRYTRTGIAGDSTDDRRFLAAASAVTAEPSTTGDGVLLQRNQFIHLFWNLTATDPSTYFSIQVWWYSPISGMWHKGETLTINDNDLTTLEVQGLDRVYLQVTNVVGTGSPTLDAWVGLVVPV